MPTIKTKKEMNLPQLIEWAIKKDIKDEKFYSKNGCHISIDFRGHAFLWDIRLNEIFTVEIEEEITEDTVLDAVVIVRKQISPYDRESTHVCRKGNVSINQVLSLQPNNSRFVYLEIHLIKNDRIDQLIWTKEKGLVE